MSRSSLVYQQTNDVASEANTLSRGVRISALDGIRGIAVMLVLFFHYTFFKPAGGYLGVDIFFVLSGYLITSRMLGADGGFTWRHLRSFYGRRARRILPPLLEMILLYIAIKIAFPAHVTRFWENLFSVVFMYANWSRAFQWGYPDYLGHAWSLGIEEQFYLLWPFLAAAVLMTRHKERALLVVTGILIALVWFHRWNLATAGANIDRLYNGTDTRIDMILTGCAGALFARTHWLTAAMQKARNYVAVAVAAACAGLVWAIATVDFRDVWFYKFGIPLVSVCTLILVLFVSLRDETMLSRCLSWSPLVYVGKRSYAIYLFHVPIFIATIIVGDIHNSWILAATGTPVTMALAILSWRYVEAPLLTRKR